MKKRRTQYIYIVALIIAAFTLVSAVQSSKSYEAPDTIERPEIIEIPERVEVATVEDGDSFSIISEAVGITHGEMLALVTASEEVYDLTSIRLGKEIEFYFDRYTDEFYKLIYEPNTEEYLSVSRNGGEEWTAELIPIEYSISRGSRSGTIESSLYLAGLEQGLDERLIIELAEVFAWQIDFGLDVRVDDSFSLIYDDRYRHGEYAMPDKIVAAKYINDGREYYAYLYTKSDGTEGYFDEKGDSVEKELLKSPLQYRYISSGYTSARYHPIIGQTTAHRAIDFAANYGTPVVSVGNGTVTEARWNGGYGNFIEVRHNETYTTRYGHFSRLAVSAGSKVTQNQVIGYVGSTGWSTGPHLHYEVYKFGTPVNPLNLDLPPLEGLSEEEMPAYQAYITGFTL